MTTNTHDNPPRPADPAPAGHGAHGGHGGHGWMMIACCVPMLVIAVALVAAGVVNAGFLVFALICTAPMALMVRGMHHPGPGAPPPDHRDDRPAITVAVTAQTKEGGPR